MLTQEKVERLLTDLSSRVRADTAAIVAFEFAAGKLSDAERAIALDILAVLAGDVEQQVREALADHLRSCPFLPRDLACRLAQDVEPVAVPILQFSTVLTDDDLIAIVRLGNMTKQLAVARRETVSEPVADCLVDTRRPEVVREVLHNQGAELTDATLSIILDRHRNDAAVHAGLVDRARLPVAVAERLIRYVSDELRVSLALRHRLPPALTDEIMAMGQERTLIRYISRTAGEEEAERLARTIEGRGWLTPMVLLRCLAAGNLGFFAAGLAVLARIPVRNAARLIEDEGPLGFRSLYAAAGLPPGMFPAFRETLLVQRGRRTKALPLDGPEAGAAIVDRIVGEYETVAPGDLEAVLGQIAHLQARPRHVPSMPN